MSDANPVTVRRPLIVEPNAINWATTDLTQSPAEGSVRLHSRLSLISPGTELRLYRGEPMAAEVWASFADLSIVTDAFAVDRNYRVSPPNVPGGPTFPVVFGYNNAAEVIEVGEGVDSLAPGDRVMTLARHQESFDVQAWECIPIPDAVPDEAAAFSYIATLGLHGLRRANFQPGENVVVVGLGLVGLCAALVVEALGARLICLDVDPTRRAHAAAALPSALVLDPLSDGASDEIVGRLDPEGVDVVLEAAGGKAALDMGMRVLDRTGRMVSIALHPEDVGSLLAADFYEKEASVIGTSNDPYADHQLRGSRFSIPGNVAYLLDLQRRGRICLQKARSHTLPVEDVAEAYAAMSQGRPDMVGVLLDWRVAT